MLDTSAPGQIGTRTLRHLCETFRYQDKSAPQLDKSAPQKEKSALVFFLSSLGSGIILESFQPDFVRPPFLQGTL